MVKNKYGKPTKLGYAQNCKCLAEMWLGKKNTRQPVRRKQLSYLILTWASKAESPEED